MKELSAFSMFFLSLFALNSDLGAIESYTGKEEVLCDSMEAPIQQSSIHFMRPEFENSSYIFAIADFCFERKNCVPAVIFSDDILHDPKLSPNDISGDKDFLEILEQDHPLVFQLNASVKYFFRFWQECKSERLVGKHFSIIGQVPKDVILIICNYANRGAQRLRPEALLCKPNFRPRRIVDKKISYPVIIHSQSPDDSSIDFLKRKFKKVFHLAKIKGANCLVFDLTVFRTSDMQRMSVIRALYSLFEEGEGAIFSSFTFIINSDWVFLCKGLFNNPSYLASLPPYPKEEKDRGKCCTIF